MSKEIDKIIPGIKRLAQAEEGVRNGTYDPLVPGKYYVDGIRYDTGRSQIAREIQQHHRDVLERFRILNIRINNRAIQQSSANPVLEDLQKKTVLV